MTGTEKPGDRPVFFALRKDQVSFPSPCLSPFARPDFSRVSDQPPLCQADHFAIADDEMVQ